MNNKLNKRQLATVKKLWKGGYSTTVIAERMGVRRPCISNHIKQFKQEETPEAVIDAWLNGNIAVGKTISIPGAGHCIVTALKEGGFEFMKATEDKPAREHRPI